VDGAQTPELVPDSLAYRHFVQAMAISFSPTSTELARQMSVFKQLALSSDDRQQFETIMNTVRYDLDDIAEERSLPATGNAVSAGALQARERRLLDDARSQLQNTLDTDDWARVERYVLEEVKRGVKIFGAVWNCDLIPRRRRLHRSSAVARAVVFTTAVHSADCR
jgi:hypothetical protein